MKRIKFYFIACLVTMNGLFIGYAVGFNSRHVLMVDPKLAAYVEPKKPEAAEEAGVKPVPAPVKATGASAAKASSTTKGASTGKGTNASTPSKANPTAGGAKSNATTQSAHGKKSSSAKAGAKTDSSHSKAQSKVSN